MFFSSSTRLGFRNSALRFFPCCFPCCWLPLPNSGGGGMDDDDDDEDDEDEDVPCMVCGRKEHNGDMLLCDGARR